MLNYARGQLKSTSASLVLKDGDSTNQVTLTSANTSLAPATLTLSLGASSSLTMSKNLTVSGENLTLTSSAGGASTLTLGSTSGTLSLGGKTLAVSASLTFTGTDSTSFAFPSSSDTVVGVAASQALTNKTYNGLTITSTTGTLSIANSKTLTVNNQLTFSGTDAGSVTFPAGTITVTDLASVQNLSNKTLDSSTVTLKHAAGGSGSLAFNTAGSVASTTTTIVASQAGNITVTLPTASGVLSTLSGTEVFTNKDYDGGTAANTSRVTLPKATTATLAGLTRKAGTVVYDTTLALPQFDTGSALKTLVSVDDSQALTNKTINGLNISTSTGTLTINNGKTLTVNTQNITLGSSAGTASSLTLGSSAGTLSLGGSTLVINNNSDTFILNSAGTVNISVPATGTLATLAGAEALTNKTVNGLTVTSTTGALTIAALKTLTVSNSLTFAGTDNNTLTFPSGNDTVATLTATQTLTNKTISGATLTGTTTASTVNGASGLTLSTTSGDVALSPGGTGKVTSGRPVEVSGTSSYVKLPSLTTAQRDALTAASGQLVYNSDNARFEGYKGAAWAELGASASSGINFVSNADAEGGVTSGVTASNVTVTAETGSNKIFGNQSFKGVSSSTSADLRWSLNSIPTFFNNNLFQATGYVNFTAINSGVTWRVGIYNVSDSTWLAYKDITVAAKYDVQLQAVIDTSKTYVWSIQRFAGTPSSDTFYVDQLTFGPVQKALGGVPVTEWTSYTPTGAFNTNVTYYGSYSRVGANLTVKAKMSFTGAPNSATATLNLPSGLTIDTSKLPNANSSVGFGTLLDNGVGRWAITTVYNTTTSVAFALTSDTSTSRNVLTQAAPFTIGSGDALDCEFSVPISEWSGETVSMANSRVEYASNNGSATNANDSSSFVYGPDGTTVINFDTGGRSRTVRFQTPILSTDKVTVQFNNGNGWFDYENFFPNVAQLTTQYGLTWTCDTVNTDILITFRPYADTYNNGSYGGAGRQWSTFNTWKWRAVKSSNPLGIGTGLATSTQPGAIASFVPRVTTRVTTVSSANYTVTDTDGYDTILVSTGASQRTITLPAVATNNGRELTIKKTDSGAGTVLIDTPGSETIDGAAQNVLTAQYSYVTIVCDGSNWSVKAVHDYLSGSVGASIQGANIYVDNTSTTVNPGRWSITWTSGVNQGGAAITYWVTFISKTSGNTGNVVPTASDYFTVGGVSGQLADMSGTVKISVVETSATTYYFKSRCAATGNVSYQGGAWHMERLR